jgi:SAM-dependent methyltransferase
MVARDPHRFINELDDDALARLVARLESRARDAVFARLLDKYLSTLPISASSRILDVGTGTGVVLRTIARRGDFRGQATGIDQCPTFVETANNFAKAEELTGRLDFRVGDAHRLDFPSGTFDIVIAHTLISHVTAPLAVLGEMARVVKPGGIVVVFDGDYASLTYAFADHDFGHQMDTALANATFNNPRIMRDLPRLLPELGLKFVAGWGDAVAEIGQGSYFKSFAETYVPYVKRSGAFPEQAIDIWFDTQLRAIVNGTFFATCNYYTYVTRRT